MFDSGVGGLTVLHECLVSMPHEDFLYAGDTAHFPYGGRSADELRGYAQEIAGWLVREGVKLIVVACNSATATALGELQRTLEVPVIGVLTPEARAAVQLTRTRRVGLLATEATIATGRYREVVHDFDAGVELVEVACPGLADAIQRGETYDETMVARVRGHCAPLHAAEVDTVILGCTHYPLIRGMIQRELAATSRSSRPPRSSPRRSRRRSRASASPASTGAAAPTASPARATPRPSRPSAAASCSCRSRACARSVRPSSPGSRSRPRPRAGSGLPGVTPTGRP